MTAHEEEIIARAIVRLRALEGPVLHASKRVDRLMNVDAIRTIRLMLIELLPDN